MFINNQRMNVGTELKALREKTGLSLEKVSKHLGMSHATTYVHYETRLKDKFVPLHVINGLIPLFAPYGIEDIDLLRLGGVQETYLNKISLSRAVLARLIKEVPEVSAEFGISPDPEILAGLMADIYPQACELLQSNSLSSDVLRLAVSAARPRTLHTE